MPTDNWFPITQPVHSPPVKGLLPTARALGTLNEFSISQDLHWVNGYTFEPETCDDEGTGVYNYCDAPNEIIPADPRGPINTMPYVIYATDRCSTFSFDARDYKGRALRKLASCESRLISRELEAGTLTIAQGWDNQYFTETPTTLTTSTGMNPTDAMACLEEYLADCLCGADGWIHAPRSVVSYWVAAGFLESVDGILRTTQGTVVVNDGGYRGNTPDGISTSATVKWAYATSPVYVNLGPVQVVPDSFTEAVDYRSNDVEYRVQRFAATHWDGCCSAAIGVQVEGCSNIGS